MHEILFQDDHLLVLDKPSGLLSVPGRGPDLQDCLSARVQAAFPWALVVHRLDRDTSGLIVMALDLATQRTLSRQFAERTVEKCYVAVVFGCPEMLEGVIDLPMRKDFDRPPCQMIDLVAGQPARTRWRLVEPHNNCSRLEVRPRHRPFASNSPAFGDLGPSDPGRQSLCPRRGAAMSDRLLLHATELSFVHPATTARCVWSSACPF